MKPHRGIVLLILGFVLHLGISATGEVIRTIPEIRALSVEEANRQQAVEITAQVIKIARQGTSVVGMLVFDGGSGIYIAVDQHTPVIAPLRSGDHVSIKGVSNAGTFQPGIDLREIRFIKHGVLPEPRKLTMTELMMPDIDCDWVTFDAVLVKTRPSYRFGQFIAVVQCEGVSFNVVLPKTTHAEERLRELDHMDISIRAVAVTIPDDKRRFVTRYFQAVFVDDFTIRKVEKPKLSLVSELLRTQAPPLELARVRGILTHQAGDTLYLRGDKGCLIANTTEEVPAARGVEIEVQGRVEAEPFGLRLHAAEARVIREGTEPVPVELPVFDGHFDTFFHDELVSLSTTLRRISEKDEITTLECQSGQNRFDAYLPSVFARGLQLEAGCALQLTGICELFTRSYFQDKKEVPNQFLIRLRDADDVRVTRAAPWWTFTRVLYGLATSVGIAAIALIWTGMLRRRVVQQTELISTQIEQEAILQERQRMARELHDTFQQNMTGVAMQLSTLTDQLHSEEHSETAETLGLAKRMLEHCRLEAREAITELRSTGSTSGSLGNMLDEQLLQEAEAADCKVRIKTEGRPYSLPARDSHHLIRIVSEAIVNALHHAKPRLIRVTFHYEPAVLRIRVEDDGCGFDPDAAAQPGHFGLLGMKERAARIDAEFLLESRPGFGTEISVALPRSANP